MSKHSSGKMHAARETTARHGELAVGPPPSANGIVTNGADGVGLGKRIFIWKHGWAMRLILSLLGIGFLAGGWSARNDNMGEMLWVGWSFGIPFFLFALRAWTKTFEIFENGVRGRSWGFARSLRYEQIGSITFWTRHEQDWNVGANSGPSDAGYRLHLRLRPIEGLGLKTVGFDIYRLAGVSDAFFEMRDRVVKEVSARMLRRIAAGERVPWGRHAAFTRRGLHFRPRKWIFFRGPEEILEGCPFYRAVPEERAFRIYELGGTWSVFAMTDKDRDFHAGHLIFTTCRYQTDEKQPLN